MSAASSTDPKNTVDKRITDGFRAQAGKGRPKGIPNKITTAAKQVIAEAAEMLGGVQRLVDWAKEDAENEAKFWTTIYPKLIPVQLTGEDGGAIKVEQVKNDAESFTRAVAGLIARTGAGSGDGEAVH